MRPLLMIAGALLALQAHATTVTYTATPLGSSEWRVDYTIRQDEAAALHELALRFDPSLFGSLQVLDMPAGWDALALQPDLLLPEDGIVDLLALGAGLAGGESLSGLTVQVSFLGGDAPGVQPFEVIDPVTQLVTQMGLTRPEGRTVPEPASWALMLLGLGGLCRRARSVA